jgi:YfiH family protein
VNDRHGSFYQTQPSRRQVDWAVLAAQLLTVPNLHALHGFTTRAGGVSEGPYASLNLGLSSGDEAGCVAENRCRVLSALGVSRSQVCAVNQVHGNTVLQAAPSWFEYDADALTTDNSELLLVISTADCLPLLFHDPVKRAVGAAHCGWRGTVACIAGKVVKAMGERYGSSPTDLHIAIGPGIRGCCYQVGAEVAADFLEAGFPESVFQPDGARRFRLDLAAANRWALGSAGVPEGNVYDTGLCTHCDPERFYSHRRDAGRTGRHWAVIGSSPTASPLG